MGLLLVLLLVAIVINNLSFKTRSRATLEGGPSSDEGATDFV